jgi:hypothetical protein
VKDSVGCIYHPFAGIRCKTQTSTTKKGINMKIGKNNFVVTFKTEKEVSDYIGMHIPEEQRLLWLGFFIANNYISQWLEDHQEEKK